MATYDGNPIFGAAVVVTHNPTPVARQENMFFGLSGIQSLDGGLRGGQIQVRGVLSGSTPSEIISSEATINSYVDGVPRTFVDNFGRSYDNVIVLAELTPDPAGIKPSTLGYSLAYTVMLQRLR